MILIADHMFESLHTEATNHGEEQRRVRIVCSSVGRIRDEVSAGHRRKSHRTRSPQTSNWSFETRRRGIHVDAR